MQNLLKRLRVLLKARYPILFLRTHEEERVQAGLKRLATAEGRALHVWRCTAGLFGPDSADPDAALQAALEHTDPALFVFFDLHPFLTEGAPRRRRRLKDLAARAVERRQTVLLVGPELPPMIELDKQLVALDVPLPGSDEIGRLLQVLCGSQNLDIPEERFERFVRGALGLTEGEIKRLFARILIEGDGFSDADLALQVQEKRQAIGRSRYLEFWERGEPMSAVGGLDNLKGWLSRRQLAFSSTARAFGLPEPKGLFLLGVQGCGKSLMAKAVAEMWKMPLLRLDLSAVFRDTADGARPLRETIQIAERLAPAVLWIDELEKGLSADAGGGQALGDFLTWMQEKQKPVFVVATANEVRSLPPELLRKGRFDEIFFVDLPNVHERLQILEIHIHRRDRSPEDFDLIVVAEETERFSGAELEQVVIAGLFAAFADQRSLRTADLLDAAREIVPLAVTMDDRLKSLREWARPRARPASLSRRRIDFFDEWEDAD